MRTIALILDGIVVDMAVWDGVSEWVPDEKYTLVDITDLSGIIIGDEYNG